MLGSLSLGSPLPCLLTSAVELSPPPSLEARQALTADVGTLRGSHISAEVLAGGLMWACSGHIHRTPGG